MSRGKWLAVLILLIVAAGAAGAVWYRFFRFAGQPTTGFVAASPDPSAVAERIGELSNPLISAPCFVAAERTCQLTFFHPADYGLNRLETRPFVSPGRQTGSDLFLAYGRMLTASGGVAQYYLTTRPPESAIEQYLEFVRLLPEKAWANQLNPAFLYTVFDQALAAVVNGRSGAYHQPPELAAEPLGKSYQEGRSLLGTGSADPLISALEVLDWTPEAKAITYALAKNFSAEVVLAVLAEPGSLERRYLQLFSPPEAAALKTVEFGAGALNISDVYQPDAQVPFFTALCRQKQAQACQVSGGSLSCSPAPWLDADCRTALLDL